MKALDDCFAFPERRLLHEEAIQLLKALARPLDKIEKVSAYHAAGRVSAATVIAPRPIPAHTNTAVDGYAFNFDRYNPKNGAVFPVGGRVAAGETFVETEGAFSAVGVFTGAMMPNGRDTVAMREDCRPVEGNSVFIPGGLRRGANRRLAGEDVAEGGVMIEPGQRLRPQDIAALTATGLGEIECFKAPRICIFSSGNEILPPRAPFSLGKVYDSNGPMLCGLFAPLGLSITYGGILPDNRAAVIDALYSASQNYNVIITSGGASLGDEDHVIAALRQADALTLWQLAIKPGRPMGLGRIGSSLVFALPGNPVAVLVCALLYVWPVIRRLSGEHWIEPERMPLPAGFEIASRKLGRREFFRGWLERTGEGMVVKKYERDGSGLISSLRAATGLIEISENVQKICAGEDVQFIPFSAFGIF